MKKDGSCDTSIVESVLQEINVVKENLIHSSKIYPKSWIYRKF